MNRLYCDTVQILKNSIKINDLIEVEPQGSSVCPFCKSKSKWYTVANTAGWCYSSKCISNNPQFLNSINKKSLKGYDIFSLTRLIAYVEDNQIMSFGKTLEYLKRKFSNKLNLDTSKLEEDLCEYSNFLNRVSDAYYHCMLENKNNAGKRYLLDRGITEDTIENTKIGYANSPYTLRRYGIREETLAKYNFLTNRGYEYYFNRVIFPIRDTYNKVRHLQGRLISSSNEEETLKYLTTKKFNNLPSVIHYLALEERLSLYRTNRNKELFICEGVPDTYSLAQCKLPVVGLLGISKLLYHEYKLRDFRKITMIADNDKFDSDHPNYPNKYKSWMRLIPQLIDLQHSLGTNTEIFVWLPPKELKVNNTNIKVKDVNEWLKNLNNRDNKAIQNTIIKNRIPLLDWVIDERGDNLDNHFEIVRLIKASNKKYLTKLQDKIPPDLSCLEYVYRICD